MTNYRTIEEFRKRFNETYQNVPDTGKEMERDLLQPEVVKPTNEQEHVANAKSQGTASSNIAKRLYSNKN